MTSLKRPHHLEVVCEACGTEWTVVVLLTRTQEPPSTLTRACSECGTERTVRIVG